MAKDDDEIEINFKEIGQKVKKWLTPKKGAASEEPADEDEIDFTDAINFLKDNKKILFYAGVISIILIGAWVRTLSIPNYKGRLLGLDPYGFHRYTEMLLENGYIPEVDELRYFPDGFLIFREHQAGTYFVAGLYLIFSPLFGGELMDYSIIYPVVAFVISMSFFYLMVKELFNKKTAIIATAFLAFAPSFLFRTIAGFSDKENMAMIFWFSMIFFLVKSFKAKKLKKVLIHGLIAGLLAGMSGLSWGGANFLFISIGLTFLILTLMNRLTNKNIITFFCWYAPMMIMNATLTLRYGGFPTLIRRDLFLIPTLTAGVVLLKVLVYELYINKRGGKKWPDSYYFGLILAVALAVAMPVVQLTGLFDLVGKTNQIIETIIHPFGTCPFCVSVTENQAPYSYDPQRGVDWWQRLRWFIPLFITGSILLLHEVLRKFKKKSIILITAFTVFMFFFMFSKFINDQSYYAVNAFFESTYLYTLPLLGLVMAGFFLSHPKSKAWREVTPGKLLLLSWFALSIIATRGAVRIIFASTPIFVLIGAYAITRASNLIKKWSGDKVYSNIPYLIAGLVIYWGFITVSATALSYWPSLTDDWDASLAWVRNNTDPGAVFTHWWDYGYWVQAMGERATTVDGGNYRVDWDEIIGGRTFSGYNITEVYHSLDYFKNNETGQRPNYLLVVDDDVLKYVQMANIGGRPGYYSPFVFKQRIENTFYQPENFSTILVFDQATGPGQVGEDLVIDDLLFPSEQSYVVNVLIPMNEEQDFGQPLGVLYNVYTGENVVLPYNCLCQQNEGCTTFNFSNSLPSCIEFVSGGVIHIPSNLKNRFMTQLYLVNSSIPGFELVYNSPTPLKMEGILYQRDPTDIKIYRIDYDVLEEWVDNGSPAW
ncbi:hypothetical protein GF352_04600 [archaeon]|nr:hypothetical protein [archaeon]